MLRMRTNLLLGALMYSCLASICQGFIVPSIQSSSSRAPIRRLLGTLAGAAADEEMIGPMLGPSTPPSTAPLPGLIPGPMSGPSLPPASAPIEKEEEAVIVPELPNIGMITLLGPDGKLLGTIEAEPGANLRKTLQASKVEVYDMWGKVSNCNGGGQCGTCVVKIKSKHWGPRSEYEAEKLKKWGPSNTDYHLACQTLVERGEATVTVRPKK